MPKRIKVWMVYVVNKDRNEGYSFKYYQEEQAIHQKNWYANRDWTSYCRELEYEVLGDEG